MKVPNEFKGEGNGQTVYEEEKFSSLMDILIYWLESPELRLSLVK